MPRKGWKSLWPIIIPTPPGPDPSYYHWLAAAVADDGGYTRYITQHCLFSFHLVSLHSLRVRWRVAGDCVLGVLSFRTGNARESKRIESWTYLNFDLFIHPVLSKHVFFELVSTLVLDGLFTNTDKGTGLPRDVVTHSFSIRSFKGHYYMLFWQMDWEYRADYWIL